MRKKIRYTIYGMRNTKHLIFILALSLLWLVLPQGVGLAATTNQISQFGITWTFDKEYQYGTFANGDYWVVGPVTITDISPGWDGQSHGSMKNPMPIPNGQQAYDSRMGSTTFNLSLLVEAPVTLSPNTSLISAISWTDADKDDPDYPYEQGGVPRPTLKTAAVLTVLGNVPPDNGATVFRPPYAGNNKPMYSISDLRRDLLPNLALVINTPDINDVAQNFERVWLDHFAHHGDGTQYSSPSENMRHGKYYSIQVGEASLLLMLDEDELVKQQGSNKDPVLIPFVQVGIDLYEVVENGGYWWGDGQLNTGRKWPIMFAGIMLDHSGMKDIGAGSPLMPYQGFQEDYQTFYVDDREIYSQPYTLRVYGTTYSIGTVNVVNGSNIVTGVGTSWTDATGYAEYFGVEGDNQAYKVDGKAYKITSVIDETHLELEENYTGETGTSKSYKMARYTFYGHGSGGHERDFVEYTEEHRGLPEWGINPVTTPYRTGLDWDATYRGANGQAFPGFVLSAHIMGQKQTWNHDALFDYIDRWIEVHNQYYSGAEVHRGYYVYGGDFQRDMWSAYRADYGCVWTRDDPSDIYSLGHYVCNTLLYGDVSGDGNISAYDAALVAMHAVGLIELTDEQARAADVTNNGTVSASDAAWIARRAVDGTIVFPVEEP